MLGRAADKIKGYYWAIKTMPLILKEVPDVKLIILSSNSQINFLKDYAKNISVYDNIIFNQYTANITEVFWNSSILMYTSLSEAFPLAMVEGKAHGLPVVAFDVAYSAPYQSGVIGVDMLDCEALAKETVKLLKDYEYRKKKGEESKLSLNQFKNEETIKLWERLFTSLLEGESSYRKLQKEIEEKYYNETKARERMEKSFRDLVRYNKNFTCHSIIDFTDINYIKNVKMCPFNETKKIDNKS
jgi:glycosyltransferase involved in cell wall biosynthesis